MLAKEREQSVSPKGKKDLFLWVIAILLFVVLLLDGINTIYGASG